VTLGYEHIDQDNISDYGVPWVPSNHNVLAEYRDRPAPVPRETFYGFRNRDVERLKASSGMIAIDHDFSDGVVFAQQVRYGHSSRESVATPPRFASPDSTEINREMRAWRTRDSIWSSQSVFRGDLDTGPITHGLVTGVDLAHETNTRQNGRAPNVQTSLLAPNPDEPYTEVAAYDDLGEAAGKTVALYAFDTLHLGEQWELVGGLRWERFAVDGVNTSLVPFDRVDTMHSLRTGLVYKPRPNGSLYLSYGTSLNPTLEGLSYSAGGSSGPEDLEPEKTYTVEAGSKWDLAEGRLLLSGSIFQVEKTNARTDGVLPDDPPTVLEGRQRARGIELGATGNLTRDWSIFGAFTFIDAKVVESNDPAESGNRLQRTPRHSGNVWTTLQIGDLSLGGGARFVGMRFGNLSNARRVDGYWTADLMASYPIHENVDLRLNVYNLNDAYYYDRLGGGHVVPGPGRAAALSTSFRF
jgi:catecholate siderophore receptor